MAAREAPHTHPPCSTSHALTPSRLRQAVEPAHASKIIDMLLELSLEDIAPLFISTEKVRPTFAQPTRDLAHTPHCHACRSFGAESRRWLG